MGDTIALLDYGMGNLHSAAKALEKVAPDGSRVQICQDAEVALKADRVVFPGVGAIRDCLAEVRRQHFDEALAEVIQRGTPVLGICVGMQSLMQWSAENDGVDCLGYFNGRVERFAEQATDGSALKVPHMGWNRVTQSPHALWKDIPDGARFYFVHSYRVPDLPAEEVAGRCEYDASFIAACARDNIFATQFHPEKSAPHGLTLLRNFLRWTP